MESNLEEFERRLKDVMRRYKIENDSLASEIVNLHKQTTHWFKKFKADFCIANFFCILLFFLSFKSIRYTSGRKIKGFFDSFQA